jgi:GNAT superfamily N-acetyltransferase
MNIQIKKLSPELTEDYLHFFDVTPHWHNIEEERCYCVCWCSADHRVQPDFSTAEKRRELAAEYIQKGYLQGYLAYLDGKVVGWCNANTKADCLNCVSCLFYMKSLQEDITENVKSVFCFVIAPEMQHKGVATKLLEHVCHDAAKEGFDYIEAYPQREFTDPANDYMGPAEMYRKCGFTLYKEIGEDRLMLRKKLR